MPSSQVRMRSPAPLATRAPSPSTAPQRVARCSHGGEGGGVRRRPAAAAALGSRAAARDSPRGFATCWASAGEGEPVGAGEPPRTRGAGPATCASHNLASSLGGHYDPVLPPRPHRVRPGTPGLHPPCIPFCLSVRHCSSAWCLLLGELGLNPSRKHLARGGEEGRQRDPATRSKGASYWRELDRPDALAPQLGLPTAPPARL